MKFNAMLSYLIPGNFVSWRIVFVEGISKKVTIPIDYDIDGVEEVLETINVHVPPSIYMGNMSAEVHNAKALSTAIFEFEKTARKKFEVLRYIGELKSETTVSIDTKPAEPKTNDEFALYKVESKHKMTCINCGNVAEYWMTMVSSQTRCKHCGKSIISMKQSEEHQEE